MPLRVVARLGRGLKAMRVERQVLFWLSAALVLVLLIALLRGIILPFVAGIVIAYFMNPAADRLTQWGVPRGVAAALIVAAFGCLIVIALIFLVPLLLTQAQQFAVALPDEITRLRALVETWAREQLGTHYPDFEAGLDRGSQTIAENMTALAGFVAGSLWSQGRALFDFLSLILVTPLVVFYVLIDWHPMLAKIDSLAAARARADHPPPRLGSERRRLRLHPRAGHRMPRARHLLCAGAGRGGAALRSARRPRHRPHELRAVRRLGARPHHRDHHRHRAVLARRRADPHRHRHLHRRASARRRLPEPEDRRLQDRPASRCG